MVFIEISGPLNDIERVKAKVFESGFRVNSIKYVKRRNMDVCQLSVSFEGEPLPSEVITDEAILKLCGSKILIKRDVASAFGIDPQEARKYLEGMIKRGLMVRQSNGGQWIYANAECIHPCGDCVNYQSEGCPKHSRYKWVTKDICSEFRELEDSETPVKDIIRGF